MTQKICDKSVDTYPPTIKLVVGALWLTKYVIKKLIITFLNLLKTSLVVPTKLNYQI